jgi:phosphatidate phosphatase APP1
MKPVRAQRRAGFLFFENEANFPHSMSLPSTASSSSSSQESFRHASSAKQTAYHRVLVRLEQIFKRLQGAREVDENTFVRCFHAYGYGQKAILRGRVETKRELRESDIDDSSRRNFLNMAANFFTKEIPHAKVMGEADGKKFETTCDDEGYFWFQLEKDGGFSQKPLLEYSATVTAPDDNKQSEMVTTHGQLTICPKTARRIIVSDIDDTVMETGAAKLWQLLRNTLLENVHTRKIFPGVSDFYRKLQAGASGLEENPIFYVTSSPWNLRDFILKVFEIRGTPAGPLFMTDWGLDESKILKEGHSEHKLDAIRHLLDFHKPLPAILVGDSGEKDPEIYANLVEEYGPRIDLVLIRDVSEGTRDAEVKKLAKVCREDGVAFHLVPDTAAAEKIARELQLVSE